MSPLGSLPQQLGLGPQGFLSNGSGSPGGDGEGQSPLHHPHPELRSCPPRGQSGGSWDEPRASLCCPHPHWGPRNLRAAALSA